MRAEHCERSACSLAQREERSPLSARARDQVLSVRAVRRGYTGDCTGPQVVCGRAVRLPKSRLERSRRSQLCILISHTGGFCRNSAWHVAAVYRYWVEFSSSPSVIYGTNPTAAYAGGKAANWGTAANIGTRVVMPTPLSACLCVESVCLVCI